MARKSVRKDLSQSWLMTFTDMLMLLVVMFVLFLSFSEINSDSFKQNAGAISDAFNQAPASSILPGTASIIDLSDTNIDFDSVGENAATKSKIPEDNSKTLVNCVEGKNCEENPNKSDVGKNTKSKYFTDVNSDKAVVFKKLKNEVKNTGLEITKNETNITINVPEKMTFDQGSAYLKPKMRDLLIKISSVIKEFADIKQVVVTGHTDNVPISNIDFQSNWQLSAARAVNVVHGLLEESNIDRELLLAVASADTQPIVPNTSRENMAQNRRVEIVLRF
ncbi:MAG: hypothetical protein CBB68_05795 [Rhodospirillaceae bacterium TMED8]|nr:hypothetical protein [Magnetovibrio sp.]OUT51139.1 MAG: hypothetical protein CBB68_05795 [Rhodospirillaceae bacterium TMED8]|tara:strand:+ start:11922 stop:12755 length:834 start_codon:yes stop_codon:yes gene_type:complete